MVNAMRDVLSMDNMTKRDEDEMPEKKENRGT